VTLAELDTALAGRKVLRHHGQCFVMSYSAEDAASLAGLGLRVTTEPSWPWRYAAEAHLHDALDFVGERDPDDPERIIDIRGRVLLEHYRERDGYSWPSRPS